MRYEGVPQGYIFRANSHGITVFFGFDPVQTCAVGHTPQLWDMQWVDNPAALQSLVHGEAITTSVWPFTDLYHCPSVTTMEPLGSGLTRMVRTVHLTPGVRLRVWSAQGWLATPAGESVHFNFGWVVQQFRSGEIAYRVTR